MLHLGNKHHKSTRASSTDGRPPAQVLQMLHRYSPPGASIGIAVECLCGFIAPLTSFYFHLISKSKVLCSEFFSTAVEYFAFLGSAPRQSKRHGEPKQTQK